MQEPINYRGMLTKILHIFGMSEEEQKEIVKTYESLVVQQISIRLLEEVSDKEAFQNRLKEVTVNADLLSSEDAIAELLSSLNDTVTPQEKLAIYNESKLEVFLEVLEPVLSDCSQDQLRQAGAVFASDDAFYNTYKEYETTKNQQNNTPN